jgi:cell division protein FtsA
MSKNKTDKIIVGLDIGTTKICAIVGQLNENGKINVLGMGKASSMGGVSRGMVSNIPKTVEAIKKAVNDASRQSNIEINTVYVGIAGHHINSRQSSRTLIRTSQEEISQEELQKMEEEVNKLYLGQDIDILHVMPQEYKIDGESGIKDPVGMHGMKIEGSYHIIAGQKTAAKNIQQAVQKAGLEVAGLMVEPVASARAVLSEEEMMAGVALVDIGGGTSDIAIFHDGIIRHTAVVELGGDIITADIMEAFGLLREQAEALKTRFGSAVVENTRMNHIVTVAGLPGRKPKEISMYNLARIIHCRATEIFNLVFEQIRLSGYKNKLGGGIVLTGGGSNLQNIRELIEYVTGIEVHIGLPHQHLGKGMVEEVKSPMYSTGVGLVLKGFDEENLFNSAVNVPFAATEKPKVGFSGMLKNLMGKMLNDDSLHIKDFE